MQSLVTGATGFLGKHLVPRLEAAGHMLTLVPHEAINRVHGKYDFVFHFGAYGNHSLQTDPWQMFRSNLEDTWTLLTKLKYESFIFCSSSSVYGKRLEAMKETDVTNPNTLYGMTKNLGEQMAAYFRATIIRPFSVYGPGEADFRFIPTVIHKASMGEKVDLDPKPRHDWIYVEDFIDGVMSVINSAYRLKGKVVNIGTGLEWTNLQVIDRLSAILASDQNHEYDEVYYDNVDPIRPYDSSHWVADNSFLKGLGWRQQYTFEQGLQKTYEYYRPRKEIV